jgi:hypothetical protein
LKIQKQRQQMKLNLMRQMPIRKRLSQIQRRQNLNQIPYL